MSTNYAVLTPAMRQIVAAANKLTQLPLHRLSPAQARERYEKSSRVLDIAPRRLAKITNFSLKTPDNYLLQCRLYLPCVNRQLPTVIFFHGGAFVVGSLDSHDALCRELSFLANCAIISVAYRLAPDYIFPTAFDDALFAVESLSRAQPTANFNPRQIIVAGDSAGGTLAAAVAIAAAKKKLPLLGQLMFYPGLAGHQNFASARRYARGWLIEKEFINWAFKLYAPQAKMRSDWRFAPLNNKYFTQLAPAWLGLAQCDPLVDDGRHYAALLERHKVDCTLKIYSGVTHEFVKMGTKVHEAKLALHDAADFLRRQFQISK